MTSELSDTEKKQLAERIARSVERAPFRAGHYELKRFPLPFYKNAYDVHIKCFTTRPVITKEYVCDDTHVFETDGEEETLAEINAALSLALNAENVTAYTSFYFQKVAIDDSFAQLIFRAEDIFDDTFSKELQENLKDLISAPQVQEAQNSYIVSGFVLLEDTLFKADIAVSQSGTVTIKNEEVAYDSLPVQRIMLR
ncbi:MAG: hypothetical protein IJ752_00810 [Alphaproteobacteria bacterium]|nr:hypothetical protein [Alphaproteobacteria bacterium]